MNYYVTFKKRSGREKHYSLLIAGSKQRAEILALATYADKVLELVEEEDFDPSWYQNGLWETITDEETSDATGLPHEL